MQVLAVAVVFFVPALPIWLPKYIGW